MDDLPRDDRARVLHDLETIEVPARAWVPQTAGTLDVVIVGAGLGGLAIAFGLMRQGICRVVVLDRAPRGREGPWRSHARMDILRSPKSLSGPDLGVPSLTFRAWFEARRGAAAWAALGRIAREDWAEYLLWYRDVLDLPVRNDTALLGFRPDGAALALDIEGPEGRGVLRTRRLILATGIDGNGRPHVPEPIGALPAERWYHSAAPFEAERLRGMRIGVVGAAASAFDCAVTALRHGATSVVLLARRPVLPRVEALAWANFPGFMTSLAELDDVRRWRFMRRLLEMQAPPTAEAFAEATRDPRFTLRLGAPLAAARMEGGEAVLSAGGAEHRVDLVMLGTGFAVDLAARPELAPHAASIARWADRHTPQAGEDWDQLGAHPYLGPGFEFTERIPGTAPHLARVHNFNTGAVASLGPVCNGITGLKHGVPRLVAGVARALFIEDADRHLADLMCYDVGVDLIPGGIMTAIAEARALGVEFGTQLANHAAMVLHAHHRLGGTKGEARRFLDAYIANTGLGPMRPSPGPLTRATWASRLGDRDFEAAHRAFFRAELARLGSGAALQREWLPRLLPGLAASALHALMRLAYANDAGDEAEMAEALGYWSACYLPLGEGVGAAPLTGEPAEVLLRVAAEPALRGAKSDFELLWHVMRAVAAEPAFAPVHDWLAVGPDTLDRIARDSLLIFAATMEFCALHAVTGAHWLRLVLPHLAPADQARAIRHFWQAIASVYPKMGFPLPLTDAEAARQRALACPGWDAIAAAACRSDDEHDISLVWSAREEQAHRGDRLYQVVAARRVGLLAD